MIDDTDIRIINGQAAKPSTNDAWETPDGKRYWFCSGAYCPGLQWKPSNTPHPSTCARPRASDPKPPVKTIREGTMMDLWRGVQEQHTGIMSFFEWLSEHGYEVSFTKEVVRDRRFAGDPVLESPSDLIDLYLSVDRVQLDNERRELLASLNTGGSS